ncbi:MAG: glutathione S-transferase [Salinarimonadaceae bacterium]|nr:MAG: glutathione S-transferase [Salinarimonadaceae bacterium]
MTSETLKIEDAVNATCPWSDKPISEDALTLYRDRVVGFCNPGCRDKFEKAVAMFDAAILDETTPLLARER